MLPWYQKLLQRDVSVFFEDLTGMKPIHDTKNSRSPRLVWPQCLGFYPGFLPQSPGDAPGDGQTVSPSPTCTRPGPRSHGRPTPGHPPETPRFFAGTSVLRRHKRMEPGNTKTSGVLTTQKIGVLRQSRKKYVPSSRNDC